VPTIGTVPDGDSCMGDLDCGAGSACFRATGVTNGVCARVCCPGTGGCDVGERCSADGVLVSGVSTGWGRCALRTECDVLMPDVVCATPIEGCYVVWPRTASEPQAECDLAGSAAEGEACVEQNDCAPGLFCAGIASRTCVRICQLGDTRVCAATMSRCVAQAYSPDGTGICMR
jgi:hypothetical protein